MKECLAMISLDEGEIECKNGSIREEFLRESINIKSGVIHKISEEDLKLLFKLYDKYFFSSYFANNFGGNLKFSLSKKMSRSAGKTIVPRNIGKLPEEKKKFEIRIGTSFLFQYYEINREKVVGGIITKDSLHALFTVMEHEIIHFLEFYLFGNSSCKRDRFKKMANNIFGHKDVYHSLPTKGEINTSNLGFFPGDNITFVYKGKNIKGFIYKINKRAAVMVLNNKGNYVDKEGNRYSKYYVPMNLMKKIQVD